MDKLDKLEIKAENDLMVINAIRQMNTVMEFDRAINDVILHIEADNPELSWAIRERFGQICCSAGRMRRGAEEVYVALSKMVTTDLISVDVLEELGDLAWRIEENN